MNPEPLSRSSTKKAIAPVVSTTTTAGAQPAPLVDIEAVAARLGVSVRHVRRLVAERRIPYVKWGHLLRFDPVDIEAWLTRGRRG